MIRPRMNSNNNNVYFMNENALIMQKGPRAEDIIWQNIGKVGIRKLGRRVLALLLFVLNSFISCAIGYILHKLEYTNDVLYSIWIVYIIIFSVNILSNYFITKYSEYEHYIKYSVEARSVLNKVVFYNMLNTILMPLVFLTLRYITIYNNNNISTNSISDNKEEMLETMSKNIFTLSLINAFMP